MFNQNRPAFGTGAAQPGFGTNFGGNAAASPFGASAFSKPATPGFGAPASNAFGQPANTSLFGGGATTNTGGSLFNPSTSSAFGQPSQPAGAFGASTFGAAAAPQNASLFGSSAPQANTSLFGSSTTGSAFGAAAAPKPAGFGGFGTPQPTTGLFGQAGTSTTGTGFFNQPATGNSMFGATQQPPAFGTVGATPQNAGTSIAKYQPTSDQDTVVVRGNQNNVSLKQHCITFMKEYQMYSLEELRLEDYVANRKGPQAGSSGLFGTSAPNTSLFGATQPQTGGLFGATQTSTATPSLFGQPQTLNTGFGQTSGFGAQTSAANSIFGAKAFGTPTTSAVTGFGTTMTPFGAAKPGGFGTGTSTGIFGQTNTGFGQTQPAQTGFSGFGQPAQQQNNSLFGGGTATSSAFGAPANTNFSGFGGATSTANAGGGLFGAQQKPATGFGGFGTTPQTSTSAFGTNTGGFGTQQPNSGIFGTTLGKPATTGFGGFGTTSQAAPSLGASTFGTTGFGGGFGQQNQAKPGLFGTGNTTGLFGNTGTSTFGTGGGTLGGFGTGNTGFGLSNQTQQPTQASSNVHQTILNLTAFPYGDNPIYKDLKPTVSEDALKPTSAVAQLAALESANKFKVAPMTPSGIKVKPIGGMMTKKSLFDGLEEYDASLEESFTLKPNPKRLIIKPKQSPKPLQQSNVDAGRSKSIIVPEQTREESFSNQIPQQQPVQLSSDPERRVSWLQTAALDKAKEQLAGRVSDVGGIVDTTLKDFVTPRPATSPQPSLRSPDSSVGDISLYTRDESILSKSVVGSDEERQNHPTGITLTRPGYYTIPSLDDLVSYIDENGRCVVPNFSVGRTGYGNVYFDEEIDVSGLNIDEIVHFRNREVIIYPDDENKPPVGEGLNRKAQITLDQVWPKDKTVHEPIKDAERLAAMDFEGKLRRICDKAETRFLEYRPDSGSWVFKVDHFSKYGLPDSDDEEMPTPSEAKKQKPNEPKPLPLPLKTLPGEKPKQWGAPEKETFDLSQSNAILQRMEVDSHKLQAMKSNFFGHEDEYDNQSVVSDTSESSSMADHVVPKWGGVMGKHKRFISPNLGSISENDRDDDLLSSIGTSVKSMEKPSKIVLVDQEASKVVPLHVKPKIFYETDVKVVLPLCQSVALQSPKVNPVFFSGRRFKVSWGPYSTLQLVNGSSFDDSGRLGITKYCSGRDSDDFSANLVKSLQFPSNARIANFRQSIEAHLEVELRHDKISRDPDMECPFFEANGGTKALPEHVKVAQKLASLSSLDDYACSVWTLCQALWSEREELEGVDELSHTAVMFRRDMFSEWIEDVIAEDEITKVSASHEYLDQLLELLLSHKVSDACDMAMKNDDYNLSLVLAQLSGGQTVKQLIQHQLALWQDVQTDKYIDKRRLKAFMVAAGLPIFHSNQGLLNIYDDMDWIKVLAFHLWYFCSPTSSITDVVLSYEKTLETTENEEISPRPPYVASQNIQGPKSLKDLRHHILHIYSRRTHPMEQLLNPATHTPDPLDFRLSWLMLQFLESLGYTHCSELGRSRIFTSFADQLENYGLWHWAIYILLHIRERSRREATIRGVLLRHIEIDFEAEYIKLENFIVDKLGIPETWIYYAKAVRAGVHKRHDDQAKFLLHSKEWNLAHEVIMEHIVPDAILNDKITFLKMLLKEFKDPKKVSNWQVQGKVLLDFIEINESVERLKTLPNDDIEMALEELKVRFGDICAVIKSFPCPTPKHRLCQSEIAQRIAYLIRSFYASSEDFTSRCSLLKLSLEKLPLPPEYSKSEIKHLLTAFLSEQLRIE